MQVIVCRDYAEMSKKAAAFVAAEMKKKPALVLGLATGSTPVGLYDELTALTKKGEITFKQVTTVNLDEYYPIDPANDQSYRYFMNENLFDRVDIDKKNTYVPDGTAKDPAAEGKRYEALIDRLGGADVQVLGIGQNGHIGFNEPADALVLDTHVTDLTENTIKANSRFFASENEVPRQALTMGMGSIFKAKKIILLVNGANKKQALATVLSGALTTAVPATLLNLHPDVTLFCTEDAVK